MSDNDTAEQRSVEPTRKQDRILSLDAARGLAILGVFCVNVPLMALPIATHMGFGPPKDGSTLDTGAWAFTRIFCEGKFYPLFSMLFGMGFILLIDRARARGRSAVPLYLRRIAILFVIGVAHISLLWFGDILLLYSVCAIALLLARNASPRLLLIFASAFMVLTLLGAIVGAVVIDPSVDPDATVVADDSATGNADDSLGTDPAAADAEEPGAAKFQIDPDMPPAEQFIKGLEGGAIFMDPEAWAELETRALRDGPIDQAVIIRLLNYTIIMSFMLIPFGFGAHVLCMFFLGAAIMRSRILENRRALLAMVGSGMAIGLPATVALVLIGASASPSTGFWLMVPAYLTAPLVSLMYLGGIALMAQNRWIALPRLIAPVGRMALTNYLTHSLVLAFLMHHWGLGLFGTFSRAELLGTVFAVYAAQIAFSHLWLSVFRFGPMEWLWRSLTYLKPQPMRAPRGLSDSTPTH